MLSLGVWSYLVAIGLPYPAYEFEINLAAFVVLALPAMLYGIIVSFGKEQIVQTSES
jgi:hypothetical protein